MRAMLRKRQVRVGIGVAVMVGMAGGLAYATIPGPQGVIQGCYSKANGSLRVIDAPASSCTSKETALAWNQQGVAGPPGPSNAYSANSGLDPVDFVAPTEPTLATLSLPAGAYVFNAKVTVGNRTGDDGASVGCALRYGAGAGVLIDVAEARLATGAPFATASFATLPLAGTRTLDAPQTVRMVCTTTSSGAFAQYAQLNAVHVGAITP
jgi:hypothetical protein